MESIISIGKDHRCFFLSWMSMSGAAVVASWKLAARCRADGQVLIAPAVWPSAVLGSTLLHGLQRGRVQIMESLQYRLLGLYPGSSDPRGLEWSLGTEFKKRKRRRRAPGNSNMPQNLTSKSLSQSLNYENQESKLLGVFWCSSG